MTIYIEYALLDNVVFDFILLYALGKILKIRFVKWRLWLAVLIGAAVAVVLPLFNLGVFLSVVIKLALSVVIVLIFASYGGKKQFLAALMLFWGLTFAMGGVLFALYYFTGESFAVGADLSISSNSLLPLFAGGILCFAFLTKNLYAYICGKRARSAFVYDVVITLGGKEYACTGFLDSGNRLTAEGVPVIIAASGKMRRAAAGEAAKNVLLGKAKYAAYGTIAGDKKKMPVVMCDEVMVGGKKFAAALGVADASAAVYGCDVLLNGLMNCDGGEEGL